jgi:TRAP-type C4-dicarboxylate transport system substrate-binding protein
MLDLGVGPLAGGTVIDAKTWNSIQQSDRDQILALAKKMQDGLDKEVPAQDTQARAEMVKRGLKVTAPDAAAVRGFREMADKFAASMKGSVVPADIYDQATRERDAFRKTRGTK